MKLPFDSLDLAVISPTYGKGRVIRCKCENCWHPTKCLNCFPFLVDFNGEERFFDEFGKDQQSGEFLRFCTFCFHKIWEFYR